MATRRGFGFIGSDEGPVSPLRYLADLTIFLIVFLGLDWLVGRLTGEGRTLALSSVVVGFAVGTAFAYGPALIRRIAK